MLCAIIGDSIAVGTAAAESLPASYRLPCFMDAKVGIPSAQIIGRVHDADVVVVSAGSNDPHNPKLVANLEAIRTKITGRVLWIVPQDRVAAAAVRSVAAKHSDLIVTFTAGRDGVHPHSYAPIIGAVRELIEPPLVKVTYYQRVCSCVEWQYHAGICRPGQRYYEC